MEAIVLFALKMSSGFPLRSKHAASFSKDRLRKATGGQRRAREEE